MHEALVFLRDAVLVLVSGVVLLSLLSWVGSRSQTLNSFLAGWPPILLGPVLPVLSRLGVNVVDWNLPRARVEPERASSRFRTVRKAIDHLVDRIAAEAESEGTPLSEIETKMLYFSETHSTLRELATVSAEFDRHYDEDAYEQKIGSLVARIMARDQSHDRAAQEAWDDAVVKLAEGDYYLSVLVDPRLGNAGKARPHYDTLKLWLATIAVVLAIFAMMSFYLILFGH
jgi:hypothetical protein